MKADYKDIRSKISEEPLWYDENGVPRYEQFTPRLSPDIYADEVILLEIACQSCRTRFFVEMSWCFLVAVIRTNKGNSFSSCLDAWLLDRANTFCPLHYGDPPRHDCVGDTMNCDDLQIVEFHKKVNFEFERIKKYEISLE